MDLVKKDMNLFNELSKKLNTPLEISPFVLDIFKDAQKNYGSRAWSSMVVKRLEDKFGINFRASGFPDELVDNENEEKGYEI
jgi:3-hydroxyisobutyrate dehydrogenase